jgi:hypothetical protein
VNASGLEGDGGDRGVVVNLVAGISQRIIVHLDYGERGGRRARMVARSRMAAMWAVTTTPSSFGLSGDPGSDAAATCMS